MCHVHCNDMNQKSKSILYMAAEAIFMTIMCIVFVGCIFVLHFMKRNEQRERL